MRIAVYGATGMVGSRIATEAVERGHEVMGFSRSGGEGVTVGDFGETAAFIQVALHNDVVVIAVPPDRTGGPHEPVLEAFEGVIASGTTSRVIAVLGAGSLEVDGVRLSDTEGFPESYKPEAVTMGKVLDLFRSAPESLSWTAVSPSPGIAPGERTGAHRVGGDSPVGDFVSAEDLAAAVVDEIENPHYRRARFTVAS